MPTVEGRTALVIGGSSGMGRGAARALAARGASVIVTSRSAGRLEGAVAGVLEGLAPRRRRGRARRRAGRRVRPG